MVKRDNTIDITKAIGIILMLIGHCVSLGYLGRFIFSFHMPLFFILSGFFYKKEHLENIIKKGYRKLITPFLITSLTCVILVSFINYRHAFEGLIGTFTFCGGFPNEIIHLDSRIGPIWFLVALFWCKIFWYFIQKSSYKFIICLILSTISFIIGKYFISPPFGILQGACALIFYAIGYYWKLLNIHLSKIQYSFGIIVWILCIIFARFDFVAYDCTLYPISMFAAFIGTYSMYLIASKTPKNLKPIMIWLGQNTMLILCYHTIIFLLLREVQVHPLVGIFAKFFLSILLPYLHILIKDFITNKKITNTTAS